MSELHTTIDSALEAVLRAKTEEIRLELAARLHAAWEKALQGREETARQARTETAASLAAAVRRIRAESSVTTIAHALVESAAEFAGRAALLLVRDGRLLGFVAGGGTDAEAKRAFEQVDLSVSEAAAIAHAIETRDPVVTSGGANDLSRSVVDLFGLTAEDRVYLFPVVLRDQVLAVLYADAGPASRAVESDACSPRWPRPGSRPWVRGRSRFPPGKRRRYSGTCLAGARIDQLVVIRYTDR